MKLIYVASPLSGNVEANIEYAKEACRAVINSGYAFFAPHLLYPSVLDDAVPAERKLGMDMGLTMLAKCDELLAFGPRISKVMEAEIRMGKKLHMPVYRVMLAQDLENSAEAQIESAEALNGMTVRQFLEEHPTSSLDMMTPGGFVYLTPQLGQILLAGGQVSSNAGWSDTWHEIGADELLNQVICSADRHENSPKVFSVLTEVPKIVEEQRESCTGMQSLC